MKSVRYGFRGNRDGSGGYSRAKEVRSLYALSMPQRDRVLVAILNNQPDLTIAREQHWYRIPVETIEKVFQKHGMPQWLAFYQTKVFGNEAYSINYMAQVLRITTVTRSDLFPHEPVNQKTQRQYYKLELSPLQSLARPIVSDRFRRVTFIPTTLERLQTATNLADLHGC
ncbi:hypothetical protein IQ268_17790 [Oculatella sp. LEGE 06141]|uniref:hypothetical protein n=1 Tax=Oculatella sp. LEGE 06141 TaxID=1828648 RepID=UPI0018822F1A|nr:hypothetical protein [Oculatella sp. LEGE 06141]MBE9180416.1 hypothetical protein [Oculatella sp. LEGE 06141]